MNNFGNRPGKKGIDRRRFLQLLSTGGAAAVLAACRQPERLVKENDCIVVGSGPVGIAAAIRLAEHGLRVLVLEAGAAITEQAGVHFRNQPVFQEDPDSYFEAIDPYLKPFTTGENTVLPGLADSALWGGQGVIWTNNCPRAASFERWDALSPSEWDQRYAEAEAALQVQPDPASGSKTGNKVQTRLKNILENARTVRSLPLSGRLQDDGSVYFNAPWDMLAAKKPQVRERIAIQSGTLVKQVVYEKGRVTGVKAVDSNGQHISLQTTALLLAGGAVGTPRLLYDSGIRPPALGRGFSFHALLFGQVVLDPALTSPALTHDLAPRLWIPPTADMPWHIQVLRDTFPLPTTEAVDNPNRLLEFQAFLPIEFRDENRFVFKENNQTEVQFDFSKDDHLMMQAVEQDVQRLASHLGSWRGGGEAAWVPHGTAHLSGTCRMDLPTWKGVADKNGQIHDYSNLYLASVGLIPQALAVNPTLTTIALALNTADVLVYKL